MKRVFCLGKDVHLPISTRGTHWVSTEQDWFSIRNGVWFIKKDTVWDGVTLCWNGPIDKTSNLPITWKATLVHDLGYAFLHDPTFPHTRKEIDDIFLWQLEDAKFPAAKAYYRAVRIFGWLYLQITRHKHLLGIKRKLPNTKDLYYARR